MIHIADIRKIGFTFPKDKGLSEGISNQKRLVQELSRYSISVLAKLVELSSINDKAINDQVWDTLYKGYSDKEMEDLLNNIESYNT